jgi:hypothetical protein
VRLIGLAVLASVLLLPYLPLASAGDGGGMTSGGGGYKTTASNPWFVGEKPVSYCVSISREFSASPGFAELQLRRALDDWIRTIRALNPGKLTTQFVLEGCQGTTELRFLLGVTEPSVQEALRPSVQEVVGLAHQTSFDQETGRARGFVWLVPDRGPRRHPRQAGEDIWSRGNHLFNVLLHELGHVFGVSHVPFTFMTEWQPLWILSHGETEFDTSVALSSHIFVLGTWGWPGGIRRYCGEIGGSSPGLRHLKLPPRKRWRACLENTAEDADFRGIKARISLESLDSQKEKARASFTFIEENRPFAARGNWEQVSGIYLRDETRQYFSVYKTLEARGFFYVGDGKSIPGTIRFLAPFLGMTLTFVAPDGFFDVNILDWEDTLAPRTGKDRN